MPYFAPKSRHDRYFTTATIRLAVTLAWIQCLWRLLSRSACGSMILNENLTGMALMRRDGPLKALTPSLHGCDRCSCRRSAGKTICRAASLQQLWTTGGRSLSLPTTARLLRALQHAGWSVKHQILQTHVQGQYHIHQTNQLATSHSPLCQLWIASE